MSEQRAAALEFLTHRREGAQIAGGGLHLLRPELVLAQFCKAFRGCFLRNPAKEIEPLRLPTGGELGDLEFEVDRSRGIGAFAHLNKVAAGAEEGHAGLENRYILVSVVAALLGLVSLTGGTAGVGGLAFALLCAVLARIAQAGQQHAALMKALSAARPADVKGAEPAPATT